MIEIKHDAKFDLATGRSRRETSWKNKEWLWSAFLEKISKTHHTAETQAEYFAAKKIRQDEIKDIGGFCGGYLLKGKRQSNSILHRQLITLDLDFSTMEVWEDFKMLYGCAAAIYSTHKHSEESPRFRLLTLADRPMAPDEYQAVSRRVAGNNGIENFDPTTFQPERLMYWPSTSKDAEYFFDYQDGPALNVDEVLATYRDWRDTSEWPVSEKIDKLIARGMEKQGDPLEKEGVLGAFCKTYSIHEAIEVYLSDIYESTDISDDRYTYKDGSTSGGMVVYEDKFAYSHHGTDPTSGKLCNAFDLVRLHKFGLKDEDVSEETPINKMPSHLAMLDLSTSDSRVKKVLISDRIASAQKDFEGIEIDGEETEIDDSWQENLDVDRKGNIYPSISNISLILENDKFIKGAFAVDIFVRKKVILKNLPWRKVDRATPYLRDEDEQNFIKYLEKSYNILNRANTKDAFDTHITSNEIHPVKEFLNGLKWDGTERLATLFIDFLGAADSVYTRAVTRKTLTAAVARIFKAGVKFDNVATLIGPQGSGKSTMVAKLGGIWFSDSFNFNMLHTKEAFEMILGFWLIEIGELAGLKKADIEAAKQFITKVEDSFRPAFGRNVVTNKRSCIFIATTNNRDFLTDPTGNRRFWPIDTMVTKPILSVWNDFTPEYRAQIWAEAVQLYKDGETLFLSPEIEAMAAEIQKAHIETDPRQGMVEKYLDTLLPSNWAELDTLDRKLYLNDLDPLSAIGTLQRNRVCVAEIWSECLGNNEKDINKFNTKDLHNIMKNMAGWVQNEKRVKFKKYGLQVGYYRDHSRSFESEKAGIMKNKN
jgi:putative DNA primase/helicase